MRKLVFSLTLVVLCATWLSCYGSKNYQNPSRVRFRAVVSNSLHPVTAGVHVPALDIMDATTDQLSFSPIGLTDLPDLTTLEVSSNKLLTLAYSPTGRTFRLVNNTTEQEISTTFTALPETSESYFLATNTLHIYAAVPNAPMPGGIPGAVIQLDTRTGAISATIPVPRARFLREANRGGSILVFSDDCLTVIAPENIGTSSDPRVQTFCGLDHPVGAGLTVNLSTAWILLCGRECGGTNDAAIVPLDLVNNTLGTPIPVPGGATVATSVGNTLYVAGSGLAAGNVPTTCSSGTAALNCGTITVIDLTGAKAPQTAQIPDGYHTKIEVSTDGQVLVGSRDCSEISSSTETRGCMGIFNPTTSKVIVPSLNGNVTGIAPIPGRNVFYAIQGGSFVVYDSVTGQFVPNHQTRIVGELIDVKVIDNAP